MRKICLFAKAINLSLLAFPCTVVHIQVPGTPYFAFFLREKTPKLSVGLIKFYGKVKSGTDIGPVCVGKTHSLSFSTGTAYCSYVPLQRNMRVSL